MIGRFPGGPFHLGRGSSSGRWHPLEAAVYGFLGCHPLSLGSWSCILLLLLCLLFLWVLPWLRGLQIAYSAITDNQKWLEEQEGNNLEDMERMKGGNRGGQAAYAMSVEDTSHCSNTPTTKLLSDMGSQIAPEHVAPPPVLIAATIAAEHAAGSDTAHHQPVITEHPNTEAVRNPRCLSETNRVRKVHIRGTITTEKDLQKRAPRGRQTLSPISIKPSTSQRKKRRKAKTPG
ncbi:unnamed protein product [Gadus morhua 'NCC']